ncbi:MAG: hypothetical protein ABSC30_02350 [Acidimicrobiales bacterium]|jgi:hypothetical protein
MRRPSWRLVAVLAAATLLAASCSGSTPKKAKTHPHHHYLQELAAAQAAAAKTAAAKAEAEANAAPSTTVAVGNTGPGSTTTVVGGVTTTTAPATAGVPTTTTPVVITRTGRIRHRIVVPVIDRLKPLQSYTGATVMIVGKRLQHATTVAFDGIVAKISFDSSTRIKAIVPVGATSGPISVITPYGTATIQGFSIIA